MCCFTLQQLAIILMVLTGKEVQSCINIKIYEKGYLYIRVVASAYEIAYFLML